MLVGVRAAPRAADAAAGGAHATLVLSSVEAPEIEASEQISELFGDDTAETAIQVIIRDDGGDVINAEGLRAAMATVEAIRAFRGRWGQTPDRSPLGPLVPTGACDHDYDLSPTLADWLPACRDGS